MTCAAIAPVDPPPWQALLEEQDQVISRRQARLGGLSEDQWQWRLDTGRWQLLFPGVAVAHSGDPTWGQRVWAAVLRAGEGAAVTADGALIQHGMRLREPEALHVLVPDKRLVVARTSWDGQWSFQPHRAARLEQWLHPARRPRVVRLPVAVVHAVAWAGSDRSGEWRLASAVQQRLVRPGDLRSALSQMPQVRRAGLMRDVLDDVELGAHAASELDLLRFLRRHGLPAPDRLQRPVRTGTLRYLDAWWERQRVSAEMDGAHHRLVGTWDDDALRANDVVIVERHDRILLLRFTRANLRHDELRVAEQLRAVLL